jgi:hypothetical protein
MQSAIAITRYYTIGIACFLCVHRCGRRSAGADHALGSGETDPGSRRIYELRVNVFGGRKTFVSVGHAGGTLNLNVINLLRLISRLFATGRLKSIGFRFKASGFKVVVKPWRTTK